MKKRLSAVLIALLILSSSIPVFADGDRSVRILFTHDMHSHLEMATRLGGSIKEEKDSWGRDNLFILDAGDFSQGTLYQAGFESDALELGLLAKLGYSVAAIGNHEWDHGGSGFARMISSAERLYDNLPALICSNIDFNHALSEEQETVFNALLKYNTKTGNPDYTFKILESKNGVKLGIFALSGYDSIECSPTSGMEWKDYIEAAKEMVSVLKDKCDVIICLSHSGTNGAGEGEDVELASAVPEIDLIISGHSHTIYSEPLLIGSTYIVSSGQYMENLGCLDLALDGQGNVSVSNYRLKPLKYAPVNPVTEMYLYECDKIVNEQYLSQFGYESPDQKIAHNSIKFIALDDMYASHQEYNTGNIIADSYIYTARKNGIYDIDVALVGLGTIRDSLKTGDISVEDAFNICSLGTGDDGSAGHPLVVGYVTGKELKLLAELDASLGPKVSSIKMSYSGLRMKFNSKRMILDRCIEAKLYDEFGLHEPAEIEDDKLYKLCCNMYAANMLGMLNGLTKGILSITPKDAEGNPIEDFYDVQLIGLDGKPIKEWVAFADYLSFLGEIPDEYSGSQGRKTDIKVGDIESIIMNPGLATWAVLIAAVLAVVLLILLYKLIRFVILKISRRRKLRG